MNERRTVQSDWLLGGVSVRDTVGVRSSPTLYRRKPLTRCVTCATSRQVGDSFHILSTYSLSLSLRSFVLHASMKML